MGFELANNAINLYTSIFYKMINKVLREELYESVPEIYPTANLIDMGINNYYDVSGSLHLDQKIIEN